VAITGASAGIGEAAARAFAREGARLALFARRGDRLRALASGLHPTQCLVHEGDVARREDVQSFVDATVARFGHLDVMVNNAGRGLRARVEDTPPAEWMRLMEINFLGTVWGCQAAVPVMRRQGSGVVVNVSSIVGHRAMPSGGAYAASKAAQVSLTEALRTELRGSGVHACTVHPSAPAPTSTPCWPRPPGARASSPSGPSSPRTTWPAPSCAGCGGRARRSIPTGSRGRSWC
jgi:NAD(P)-dependent dehydrogenase (short-subunit alcohol dehydrogenase family)